MDLTNHFDSEGGQVLYIPNFADDDESTLSRLVEMGAKFERTGSRVRGGLCKTGKEVLLAEKNVKSGIPGIKWENSPVEGIANKVTGFLHENNILPGDLRPNFCLYNKYETGSDSISGHSDSELNSLPINISVTFGYPRKFVFTNIRTKDQLELNPASGSMLIFRGDINTRYFHHVPPERTSGVRVNLSFRVTTAETRDVAKGAVEPTSISISTFSIDHHKRSSFCDDFHFVTPGEAMGRSDCLMYKNWGVAGNVCSDQDKIRNKIGRMRDKSRVFGSSDWFIVPGSSTFRELESRLRRMEPYMKWRFPKMSCYRPVQIKPDVFAQIYLDMPAKGPDRTYTVLLEKVF